MKKLVSILLIFSPFFVFGQNAQDSTKNNIFLIVEDMPEFPGGEIALRRFILENLRFPEIDKKDELLNTFQVKIYVRFIINENGDIVNPEIVRGDDTLSNNEVLRVINLLPKWISGKQNGENVSVWYTIPIHIDFN